MSNVISLQFMKSQYDFHSYNYYTILGKLSFSLESVCLLNYTYLGLGSEWKMPKFSWTIIFDEVFTMKFKSLNLWKMKSPQKKHFIL